MASPTALSLLPRIREIRLDPNSNFWIDTPRDTSSVLLSRRITRVDLRSRSRGLSRSAAQLRVDSSLQPLFSGSFNLGNAKHYASRNSMRYVASTFAGATDFFQCEYIGNSRGI